MKQTASFRFFGELTDFLPRRQQEAEISYQFDGTPAVKDAIEAIGVPHPEVQEILINGQAATFYTHLHPNDRVEVYPITESGLQLESTRAATFILDVHLGKLARSLRLLGFDTRYENSYSDKTIVEVAATETRIVLTRDVDLLKNKRIERGYWLRSQHAEEQLAEVVRRFGLRHRLQPFVRCIVCNGDIAEVPKAAVSEQLPPKTRLYFDTFFQCCNCRRVYWKGSHYERMLQFIDQVKYPERGED